MFFKKSKIHIVYCIVVLEKSLLTEMTMSIKVKIPNRLGLIIDSILPILHFAWAGLKLILRGCLSSFESFTASRKDFIKVWAQFW